MTTEPEVIVAGVALAISVIALAAAALQVAQQYFASASNYNTCDARVMGDWHQSRKRLLRFKDFRLEVQYDAPVIFLTRPDYTGVGPVPPKPVIMLSGDDASREASWTVVVDPPSHSNSTAADGLTSKEKKKKEIEAIHTADNDLATWVKLLQTIQNMESKSTKWQEEWFKKGTPKPGSVASPEQQEAVRKGHTLVVAMQKKTKSYDTMPAGIKKPFGTTTWCHLIELTAMLGIYWVEFDRTNDRYRAEGNGFVVAGEKVSDLGVMFSFQVAKASRFEENRVIPSEHVKDLAFGIVPTVYCRTLTAVDRRLDRSDQKDIGKLHFSSRADIADSLVLIGCNANAVNYFARDDHLNKRVTHLFPLAFEIIGMLAKTFHIEHSGFRYLPNPTYHIWSNKNFSLPDILVGYIEQMEVTSLPKRSRVAKMLVGRGNDILEHFKNEAATGWPSFALLKNLHDALEHTDVVLTGVPLSERPKGPPRESTQVSGFINLQAERVATMKKSRVTAVVSQTPAEKPKASDVAETDDQKVRRKMVQDVLRSHIQEVLSGLNKPAIPSDHSACVDTDATNGPAENGTSPDLQARLPRFDDIDSATPEDKQSKLMQVYFQVIRAKVVKTCAQNAVLRNRRGSTATVFRQSSTHVLNRFRPHATVSSMREEEATELGPEDQDGADVTESRPQGHPVTDDDALDMSDVSHEDIWCTLVFRMICWLMLHDFDQMDIQKPKKELHGSRLRVYIA
ncbi:hypothetical protein F5X68DRAFT_22004 [Plectosphaerella plurivora]|uniref:Modin n=1 Tax=Plectosphaerella plurivora TaxID=936078 RepID=A0A9P8V8M6_9PEZI|nr:hypothetical protein F5X68DRAFT_22004 [Plectosphaerella plurivora]